MKKGVVFGALPAIVLCTRNRDLICALKRLWDEF